MGNPLMAVEIVTKHEATGTHSKQFVVCLESWPLIFEAPCECLTSAQQDACLAHTHTATF